MRTLIASIVLVGGMAVSGAGPAVAPNDGSPVSPAEPFEVREVRRIRGHFDSVLVELAGRDVSGLTQAQRLGRADLVATLSAYRDRGAFPRNYDFPGRSVPYFVDRKTGILCAVAHLLESTGRRDIVDRVAAIDNNVWVPELANDSAFTGWLAASGLTLEEAARIQVPYDDGGSVSVAYVSTTAATYALSLGTSILNATANRNGRAGVIGVVGGMSGIAAIGLGIGTAGMDGAPPQLAVADIGLGAATLYIASRSMRRGQRAAAARREAAQKLVTEPARRGIETTLTPTFSTGPDRAAGLTLQVRF
jgi:hypothetical protein